VHRIDISYEVGDRVFLQVKLHKSTINFGKGAKISPNFVGCFKVVGKKGNVAYQLAFLDSLRRIHNVFHVSILRHYVSDFTECD
jgi:hypothetical protein